MAKKEDVLKLRDKIFMYWEHSVTCAYSGMPADPTKEDDWYIELTKLAEEIGGDNK